MTKVSVVLTSNGKVHSLITYHQVSDAMQVTSGTTGLEFIQSCRKSNHDVPVEKLGDTNYLAIHSLTDTLNEGLFQVLSDMVEDGGCKAYPAEGILVEIDLNGEMTSQIALEQMHYVAEKAKSEGWKLETEVLTDTKIAVTVIMDKESYDVSKLNSVQTRNYGNWVFRKTLHTMCWYTDLKLISARLVYGIVDIYKLILLYPDKTLDGINCQLAKTDLPYSIASYQRVVGDDEQEGYVKIEIKCDLDKLLDNNSSVFTSLIGFINAYSPDDLTDKINKTLDDSSVQCTSRYQGRSLVVTLQSKDLETSRN